MVALFIIYVFLVCSYLHLISHIWEGTDRRVNGSWKWK